MAPVNKGDERRVYLDHHATTPVDERVLDTMLPYLRECFGNAASRSHVFGWEAEEAVEAARKQVAAAIGATPREILWTSGATESNNLALSGVVDYCASGAAGSMTPGRNAATGADGEIAKPHIVSVATEHPAILDTLKALGKTGRAEVTLLKPARNGLLDPQQVADAMTDATVLVSVMHANNEIGVIQPMPEIATVVHERGVLLHCDAAQSLGRVPVNVAAMGVDLLSMSGHKVYGPKGVGALYVRSRNPRVRLAEQMHGGGHERGMRSGTLNVPGIVGMGRAMEIAVEQLDADAAHARTLRDQLWEILSGGVPKIVLNGDLEQRLPGNLNVSIPHVESTSLMMGLRGVAISSGSACASATLEPSHVLRALGVSDALAHASVRFGVGRGNTADEIEYVGRRVVSEVARIRKMSPLWRG